MDRLIARVGGVHGAWVRDDSQRPQGCVVSNSITMTTLLPLVLIFAVLCVLDVDEIILRHVDSDPARGAGGAGMDVPWVLRGV